MILSLTILLLVLICAAVYGGNMNSMYKSIPKQIKGWQAEGKDEIYDRETIYKHINGGAELYLAYGFQEVLVRRYAGPGDNEIVLDIYDMGSPADAFGVFNSEREDDDAGIGQGSEYGSGLMRFWKDRYFVSILAVGDDKTAEPIIMELGRAAAAAIKSNGPLPDMLDRLPQQGLDKRRIRYFHKKLLLNKHYYVADENILDLSSKTDCLLAEYPGSNEEPTYLLLIRYPDTKRAQKAYAKFLKAYMPEAADSGYVKTENQKWTMAEQNRDLLKIVFDAPTKEQAAKLQAEVK